MNALNYQPHHKRRFAAALSAAALIHVAAIGLATTKREVPAIASAFPPGDPIIEIEAAPPIVDPPQLDESDPLPTPPAIDPSYVEETPTPPPIRRNVRNVAPIVRPTTRMPSSTSLSSAKVFAVNAPRPEYPFEARRQKITGDGVAVMSVDSASGYVVGVTMTKSTGSAFLDNAAMAGFRRWRFKPGTVSSVTCPVTFTLTGVSD